MADDVPGCLACDLTAGRRDLPGGLIHDAGGWRVEHCVGPLGVGTLLVKPKRHVTRVAELTMDEAQEQGPLLCRCAAVVDSLVEPEQTYVCIAPPEAEVVSFAARARRVFASVR